MSPPQTEPTISELAEGLMFYPVALVISATVVPGMTLCIPALAFVAALVLIPLVAVALVVAAVAAVVAAPFLLAHAVRALLERRAESRRKPRLAPASAGVDTVAA
jgi:hypothetical protein